jgi:hypothetical protein
MERAELEGGSVCRLVPISGSFPLGSRVPLVTNFCPSSEDIRTAELAGTVPLLSVWDEDLTTLSQAKSFFGRGACVGFGLSVKELRAIKIPSSGASLRVLRDPLPPDLEKRPGGKGHCGIEGLARPPGEQKQLYKFLRMKLCDLAEYRG